MFIVDLNIILRFSLKKPNTLINLKPWCLKCIYTFLWRKVFNKPFSFISDCSRNWQIHHFLTIFLQYNNYLIGYVKFSILISTEKTQLRIKFPYKTHLCSSFLVLIALKIFVIYNKSPKLAHETNKDVGKVSNIKMKN